ncbi:terminase small subunit [Hoeflea poritis]|uniref:Terminase small subunit n=1 Tax=Hoeflea poritis TaxID=2993659 RepID=A0ABT4VMI9_9HYPH|nr:terminase small subunit [Hoeflea poritis]MDA4845929.1 terminase small subunit [Hoeflea poritis]
MAKAAKKPLNDKQKLFVTEYLKDMNATQAALRTGYSKKTAYSQGQRLLKNVEIQKAIEEAQDARLKRVDAEADWVLQRLLQEAEADIADIYNEDGTLKPVHEWPKIWRMGLVSGIEVEHKVALTQDEEGGEVTEKAVLGTVKVSKIKISDRIKRIDMIGKHISVGAFKERVEHDASEKLRQFFEQISGKSIRPSEG